MLDIVDALNYPVCLAEWEGGDENGEEDDYNSELGGDMYTSVSKMVKRSHGRLSTQQETLFSNIESAVSSRANTVPSGYNSHFFSRSKISPRTSGMGSAEKMHSLYMGNENEWDFMFQPCTQLWTEGFCCCLFFF